MDEGVIFSKEWLFPSECGYEKKAMDEVSAVIDRLDPESARREDMLTAVAEACLNAFEHGNRSDPKLPVRLQLRVSAKLYRFCVFDEGAGFSAMPDTEFLAEQNWEECDPRGWGIFLIRSLADRVETGECGGKFYFGFQFDR